MSRSTRITILSKSQDIKKHGSVEFSMKGKGAIDEFTISSQSVQIGFFNGQTNSIEITKQEGQSIIARIISSLDSKEINTGTEYNAREFMTQYLPGFSKILSSPPRGNKGISNINNQQISESKSTVGTTTLLIQETSSTETVPTTGITSTEDTSTVGIKATLPTKTATKPIVGKKSFNFEASEQLQRSTTQGISRTTKAIAESNTSKGITRSNGEVSFSFGKRLESTSERSVFHSAEVEGPNSSFPGLTAGPGNTDITVGMLAATIASWTFLGVGGLLIAGIGILAGAKMVHYYKSSSIYTFGTSGDQHHSDPEGQRQPLNPKNASELPNNGGATVITMELVPGSEVEQQLLSQDGEPVGENAPTRLPRARSDKSDVQKAIDEAKKILETAKAIRVSDQGTSDQLPQPKSANGPNSSVNGSLTSLHSGVSAGSSFDL